jgi:hypothetical protein
MSFLDSDSDEDDECAAAIAFARAARPSSCGQGPQGPKRVDPSPFNWLHHMDMLSPAEFKAHYRLSHEAFNDLLAMLRPMLEADDKKQASRSRRGELRRATSHVTPRAHPTLTGCPAKLRYPGGAIPPEVRLAIALRFLAGGQTLDLRICFHVSQNECYRSVWLVVDGVNGCSALQAVFPFDDYEKLSKLEQEFRAKSTGGIWIGQVMAIDGVHFEQLNPGDAVPNSLKYFVSRKDCCALLCIAGCDAECRFLMIDISQLPTTHDSMAWAATPEGRAIELGGRLHPDFFINGDNAFNLEEWMMVPCNDGVHADFDFFQSSNRVVIERAFGILIRRWGILWRPLEVQFRRRAPLIKCCMLLHNYCITKRVELNLREQNGLTEIQPGRWDATPLFDKEGRPVRNLKTLRRTADVPSGSGKSTKRDALIADIAEAGLHRPKKAAKKSKRSRRR